MDQIRVLFVCIHNSARSQMAEALLKDIGGGAFHVESAGFEPGKLNPLAIEVMKEEGIDISQNQTKRVFDMYKAGRSFQYVIAVCDAANAERCPIFPGITRKINWSFKDPSSFEGSWEEKLEKTREVRDEIKETIQKWVPTVINNVHGR